MAWQYVLSAAARHDLKRLSIDNQKRVIKAIQRLVDSYPQGDIIKMKGFDNHYRLRVGGHRVVFEPRGNSQTLVILEIEKRGDIY